MQKPDKIIDLIFNNRAYKVEITGNVDKSDGFIYYTFKFDEESFIVISKFDGDQWKIANMTNDSIAEKLGKWIEALD
ncbi:MAG TPA: hypothetical protein DIW37_08950 [Chryseobacterium sp.]|uniref:Uncharacterized protein n=1 Tax=Chryseobacterium mucoviscidosis TaxID=1945581 RepID=A0A202C813_9FLAO|nr:hypothetical protein [Chryseobacterium mucoviscidosis]OVE59923.1 hypothetical protein B0E34_04830 [Chryseobacterium mucoviscidosis]HCR76513.1 hypothetical protein [Chryseobacterium sp.]